MEAADPNYPYRPEAYTTLEAQTNTAHRRKVVAIVLVRVVESEVQARWLGCQRRLRLRARQERQAIAAGGIGFQPVRQWESDD